MKILLVNDFGTEAGGVETYIVALKRTLATRGHDVRILSATTPTRRATFSDYTFPGIDARAKTRFLPYMFNLRSLAHLERVLHRFEPDVVHLHYTFYDCSPSILIALHKYPTVQTLHAHEVLAPVGVPLTRDCQHDRIGYCRHCLPFGRYLMERAKRMLWWRLSGAVDAFVAPSEYYEHLFESHGLKNVVHIPNAIQLLEPRPMPCSGQLLFVGRLEQEKGVHVLIQAMKEIHRESPTSRLVIVGNGSEETRLRRMVSILELDDVVEFVGRIGHDRVQDYYTSSDVISMPSTADEPFGLVGLEAMSVGRPVIGSNVGGIPDWLQDGKVGFLVPPGDAMAIAAAAFQLLSNEALLRSMGRDASLAAVEFGMDKHVDRLVELYRQCVATPSAAPTSASRIRGVG